MKSSSYPADPSDLKRFSSSTFVFERTIDLTHRAERPDVIHVRYLVTLRCWRGMKAYGRVLDTRVCTRATDIQFPNYCKREQSVAV